MRTRAKVLEFEASITPDGSLSAEECPPLELPQEWTAEHLLLAALLRCSLTSLRYHAKRTGAEARGGGSARGAITKREEDERYAFVEIDVSLEVELVPAPPDDGVASLLAKAERYAWQVNGRALSARAAPS